MPEILISKCGDGPLTVGLIINHSTTFFIETLSLLADKGHFNRILFPSSIQSFNGYHKGKISGAASGLCTQKNWDVVIAYFLNKEVHSLNVSLYPGLELKAHEPESVMDYFNWKDLKLMAEEGHHYYNISTYNTNINSHYPMDGIEYDKYNSILFCMWQAVIVYICILATKLIKPNLLSWRYYFCLIGFYACMVSWQVRQLFWPVEFLEKIGNEDLIVECTSPENNAAMSQRGSSLSTALQIKLTGIFSAALEKTFLNLFHGPWEFMLSTIFDLTQKIVCIIWADIVFKSTLPTLYIMNDNNHTVAIEMRGNLKHLGCNVMNVSLETLGKTNDLERYFLQTY